MKTRYNKFVLSAVFASVFAANLVAQPTVLPYKDGFEGVTTATTDWSFVPDPHNPANEWVIGSAVRVTDVVNASRSLQSLYVSADGGITANYNDTASSTIFAYREFTLPEHHSYSIYFDWRSGSALGDSLYVCWVDGTQNIAPEADGSLPAWVDATKKLVLGGQPTNWQNGGSLQIKNNSFSVCGTGQPAKLVFVWRNNGDGTGPSAAPSASRSPAGSIDNLQINQNSDLNYITSFNSPAETVGWNLYNGSSQNKWEFGSANYFSPGGALYISKDGGATHSYANSASCVSAVREFTLSPGEIFNIDFEYMSGGESNDYLLVGWLTDTTRTNFTNTNGVPPTWFVDVYGVPQIPPYLGKLNNAISWQHFSAQITGNGRPGKLILMWVNDANIVREPAAIIDNLTVTKDDGCKAPTNISTTVDSRGITILWSGSADSYNLSYSFTSFSDCEMQPPQYITVANASMPYTIPNVERGVYSIVVNGVCRNMPYCGANGNIEENKNDTSAWGAKHDIAIMVNPGCIDYTDLTNTAIVTAEYASSWTGVVTNGLVDYGYENWLSRHTVHYIPEYDTITLGGLRTIPECSMTSVRLGNKGNDNEWEGLTYTFTVDQDYALLVLQYATVLEAPGHNANYSGSGIPGTLPPPPLVEFNDQDPKITLDILNANNQIIDQYCAKVNLSSYNGILAYYYSTDPTWHYIPAQTITVPYAHNGTTTRLAGAIYWKDWTTIGVNLREPVDLRGQTIKVRIRNYDCSLSGHFGYSYFTLNCAKAELEGLSCGGGQAEVIGSPEGFNYCWYKKYNADGTLHIYNPNTTVCVSMARTFEPANNDTATYICRLTSIASPSCSFNLTARLAPRLPRAVAGFSQESVDCQNIVTLRDRSVVVYGENEISQEETTETSYWLVTQQNGGVTDTILISDLRDPQFIALNGGGVYDVRLVSGISGDQCTDTLNMSIEISPISEARDTTKITVCYSQLPYTYGGKVYDVDDIEDGFIINNDTIITDVGCDSILTLILSVKDEILIEIDSTVCFGEMVLFEGVSYYETGVYSKTYQNAFGCDSVMQLNLNVNPVIDVFITDIPKEICADDPDFAVAYENRGGSMPTRYILTFNETTIDAGFENDTIEADGTPMVFVTIPESLRPNHYSVRIEFVDDAYGCSGTDTTVNFDVLYPSYILEQKWNDVIALLKPSVIVDLPNYGHTSNVDDYTFSAYQWYKNNDTIIDGKKSYIYIKDGILDFDAKYTLLLTRLSDGVVLSTCSPVLEKRSEEIPVVIVQQRDGVKMLVQNSGVVNVYSVTGILLSSQRFNGGGEIIINAPSVAGVYILNINLDNGERYKEKIVVN